MKSALWQFLIVVFWLTQAAAADLNGERGEAAWRLIADDLELGIVPLRSESLFPVQLLLLRTELERYQIRVLRAGQFGKRNLPVHELCSRSGAQVCINASFFDENRTALGLVVSSGIQYRPLHRGGGTLNGVFRVSRHSVEIIEREETQDVFGVEAFQSGPLLLRSGEAFSGIGKSGKASRRSGVCIDAEKRLIIFAVGPPFGGISLSNLVELLQHDSVGCVDALNLDGGGSTQLFVSSALPGAAKDFAGVNIVGRDTVPVALSLFTSLQRSPR